MDHRYNPQELIAFIKDLFHSAGMELEKCEVVAPLLIEADLIGHTTHGIAPVSYTHLTLPTKRIV